MRASCPRLIAILRALRLRRTRDADGTRTRDGILDELEHDAVVHRERVEQCRTRVLPVKEDVAPIAGANKPVTLAVRHARNPARHAAPAFLGLHPFGAALDRRCFDARALSRPGALV